MDRFEITSLLERQNIRCRITEHPPAETIDEIDRFGLPDGGFVVKNLFLRDDKKRHYYLVVVKKDKAVDLKGLRALLGSRPLSFASEQDLSRCLGLPKGAVTPLGILNDEERRVEAVIDEEILRFPVVGVHPNEHTATLWLAPQDLVTLIKQHGNPVTVLNIQSGRKNE